MADEIIGIKNGSGYYIKRTYIILTLILTLIAFIAMVSTPFVWKESINIRVEDSIKRLEKVERRIEAIDRIEFNLKQYMQSQGVPYTEIKN